MPTGVPSLESVVVGAHLALNSVTSHIRLASDYLEIPSYDEFSTCASQTWHDSVQAFGSTWHLIQITSRPLLILLALLGRYLAILLRVLTECTIKHGVVAAREGANQANFAVRWIIAWQKSLSRAAVLVELGVLGGLSGLYLLRRYLKKRRYFDRLAWWYAMKKAKGIRKYNRLVAKVSQTSLFLARLLPHLLYMIFVCIMKYFAPWLIQYFAVKTYATAFISLWAPFVKTVWLIHRWNGAVKRKNENSKKAVANLGKPIPDKAEATTPSPKARKPEGKRSSVVDRYLQSMGKSSTKVSNSAKANPPSAEALAKKGHHIDNMQHSGKDSPDDLYEEAMELLKYWVVYALVCAFCRVICMLPIFGRIIPTADPSLKQVTGGRVFSGRNNGPKSFLSLLRLSYGMIEECKLVFYLWLRCLPTSLTGTSQMHGSDIKAKTAAWEKKSSGKNKSDISNKPLDIVYHHLAPSAIALMDSSLTLAKSEDTAGGVEGMLGKGVNFFQSFLGMAVFMKCISENTKGSILQTLTDCAALLPASITLLMPSYFTQFGCVYVSRGFPAACSASIFNTLRINRAANNHSLDGKHMVAAIRFLKYWILYSLLAFTLKSFQPLLVWIPLSTHVTWVLWAYVQLEGPTQKLYSLFEQELMTFGLLRRHEGDADELKVENSMAARVLRKVVDSLPSGTSLDEAVDDTSNRVAQENAIDSLQSGAYSDEAGDGTLKGTKQENANDSLQSDASSDEADDGVFKSTAKDNTNDSLASDSSSNRVIDASEKKSAQDKVTELPSSSQIGDDRLPNMDCSKPASKLDESSSSVGSNLGFGASSQNEVKSEEVQTNLPSSGAFEENSGTHLARASATPEVETANKIPIDTSPVASPTGGLDTSWENVHADDS